MNAKRALAVLCCAGFAAPAPAQSIRMTHNVVDDVVEPGTVQCAGGDPQFTSDNHFWRSFDLSAFGLGDITVRRIEFGIERFFAPSFGGMTEVTINLYRGVPGQRPMSGMMPECTVTESYADAALTMVSAEVCCKVDEGTALIVEIVPQNFAGSTMGDSAWIGSNGFGETAPTYLSSSACGISQPMTYPEIGCPACFGDIHVVVTVVASHGHEECVMCYPDCDESGSLDFFDFLCFQNAFASGDLYADCDGSGDLDFFDFLCFQNHFAMGCP